jgi:ketosteroid isomerase-like protein
MNAKIENLIAKDEIRDVLMRYARGVDRADGGLLKSCYHEDAIEEHGSAYAGPAHAYIDGAIPRIRSMGAMAHYVCNISITVEADVAYVESYVLTFARIARGGRTADTLTGGRICDRFERRGAEWKIAHRKMAFDWNRDMATQESWCLGMFSPDDPRMVLGKKSPDDLSYARF